MICMFFLASNRSNRRTNAGNSKQHRKTTRQDESDNQQRLTLLAHPHHLPHHSCPSGVASPRIQQGVGRWRTRRDKSGVGGARGAGGRRSGRSRGRSRSWWRWWWWWRVSAECQPMFNRSESRTLLQARGFNVQSLRRRVSLGHAGPKVTECLRVVLATQCQSLLHAAS